MPQTVHCWLEDEDRSGAETGIAAIADDLIITSGDSLRLREDMPFIALAYAWTEFAAYPVNQIRLSSPKISGNPIRLTKGVALNYTSEGLIYDFRDQPLGLIRPGDNVTGYGYEEDEAGVAHYLGIALVVSDGIIPKIAPMPINYIHRCTAAAATAATWSQLSLTEVDALPAGNYHMLGARVENALAMAARFVFKGMEARPAVIPVTRSQDHVHSFSQFWGRPIPFVMPGGLPDLEILAGGTGTSEIELYLNGPRE